MSLSRHVMRRALRFTTIVRSPNTGESAVAGAGIAPELPVDGLGKRCTHCKCGGNEDDFELHILVGL